MLIKVLGGIGDGEATASRIGDGEATASRIADGEALARSLFTFCLFTLHITLPHHFAGKVMGKVNK